MLAIAFHFWLGQAAVTVLIMGVYAAACLLRDGRLPEQDIPYWQGLLIYLPVEGLSAIVFALTALITSAIGVYPLILHTGVGAASMAAAGGIHVAITAALLAGNDEDPRARENRRLLVQEQPPSLRSRTAAFVPVFGLLILPIILYGCLQLLPAFR